jgi:hypothetical protein
MFAVGWKLRTTSDAKTVTAAANLGSSDKRMSLSPLRFLEEDGSVIGVWRSSTAGGSTQLVRIDRDGNARWALPATYQHYANVWTTCFDSRFIAHANPSHNSLDLLCAATGRIMCRLSLHPKARIHRATGQSFRLLRLGADRVAYATELGKHEKMVRVVELVRNLQPTSGSSIGRPHLVDRGGFTTSSYAKIASVANAAMLVCLSGSRVVVRDFGQESEGVVRAIQDRSFARFRSLNTTNREPTAIFWDRGLHFLCGREWVPQHDVRWGAAGLRPPWKSTIHLAPDLALCHCDGLIHRIESISTPHRSLPPPKWTTTQIPFQALPGDRAVLFRAGWSSAQTPSQLFEVVRVPPPSRSLSRACIGVLAASSVSLREYRAVLPADVVDAIREWRYILNI